MRRKDCRREMLDRNHAMNCHVLAHGLGLSVEVFVLALDTAHTLLYFLQLRNVCTCTGNARHSSLSLQLHRR